MVGRDAQRPLDVSVATYYTILKLMTQPIMGPLTYGQRSRWNYCLMYHQQGNFWGCAQGYFGQCIGLWLSMKRNQAEKNRGGSRDRGSTNPWTAEEQAVMLRHSVLHWRQEAEKDFCARLIKPYLSCY